EVRHWRVVATVHRIGHVHPRRHRAVGARCRDRPPGDTTSARRTDLTAFASRGTGPARDPDGDSVGPGGRKTTPPENAPPFPFRSPSPHTMLDAVHERVLEALDSYGAAGADVLRGRNA